MRRDSGAVRSPLARVASLALVCGLAAVFAPTRSDAQLPSALPDAATWDVAIGDVDAAGTFRGAEGVAVEIVPMATDRDGALQLGDPLRRTSTAGGKIAIPAELQPGQALVRYDAEGGRAVASLVGKRARLGRYARALQDADLSADVRVNLEVGDSGLRAWQLVTLTTEAQGARRWTEAAPLQLPLLAPTVGDGVLDRGLFPDGLRALKVEIQGDGVLQGKNGALALVGSVAPGRPLTLRIQYPIAVPGERVRLGLRGVFGETALMVAALAVSPAAPRFASTFPARIGTHREGRERLAGFATLRAIRPGEVVTLDVLDLPTPPLRPRRLLASLFLGLSLLALGAATRRRRS
ncbi:MAG: hypothetical protein H6747_10260 [Deltaproteobacteria bacterium]|nr:hypothetical protein [Deltaproteobacteria bacterium]